MDHSIPGHLEKTVAQFKSDIEGIFGEQLRSVVLYGPSVRGEKAKEPYINFLVVVDDNTPSELAKCAPLMKGWRKNLIATPLFLASDYIARSLDTFPLEFMAMQQSYAMVMGDDPLESLEFNSADVRSQCERELKGKLIHLRAEYLNLRGNKKGLTDLVQRSLATFRLLFSGALYLKGLDIPESTTDIMAAVVEAYELDSGEFKKLTAVAHGEIKLTDTESDELFDVYVEELMKLSKQIDSMEEE